MEWKKFLQEKNYIMTFCVENETNQELPFDVEDILGKVIERALEQEGCPYEANVAVLLTDNEGIHAMNKEFRQIDKPTDVLSFPNVDYDAPADFTGIEDYVEDYFDPETGEKLCGVTHQGYSDNSCWARGQAWGICGIAFSYSYTRDERLIPLFNELTECFLSKRPKDNVPYWDMVFTDGDEPRDTSAAAIAACGILEMNKYIKNEKFMSFCTNMIKSLCENYLTQDFSNGILTDGMYSRPHGDKPECNIWGDYFFMEALMRINNPNWKMYW